MTVTEMFDAAFQHLMVDQLVSMANEDGFVPYRNGALKSGVGFFIKDEHYSDDLNDLCVSHSCKAKGCEKLWGALFRSGVPDTKEAREFLHYLEWLDAGDYRAWLKNPTFYGEPFRRVARKWMHIAVELVPERWVKVKSMIDTSYQYEE